MKSTRRHVTHSELNNLLDEIECGKPVDSNRLKLLIAKNKMSLTVLEHFLGTRADQVSQGIEPRDMEGWREWRQRVVGRQVVKTDKVSAARSGNSHVVSGNYSMIPCWPNNADNPILASCRDNEWYLPFKPTKTLLLLENEALFLMRPDMKEAIAKIFPELAEISMDWAFASGNEINRAANKGFIEKYETVYVMTDPDLGGLIILINLLSLTSDADVNLISIYPKNITLWLKEYGYPINEAHRANIIELLPKLPDGALKTAKAIIKSGLVIEQEVYLRSEL